MAYGLPELLLPCWFHGPSPCQFCLVLSFNKPLSDQPTVPRIITVVSSITSNQSGSQRICEKMAFGKLHHLFWSTALGEIGRPSQYETQGGPIATLG